jgi:hypothetical protein
MRYLVVVLTVGCAGGKAAQVVGNRAAPPPKPACTDERVETVANTLRERWNTDDTPVVRCTPGLFPTPGFFIEASDGDRYETAVIDLDGEELVPFRREPLRIGATSIVECATTDLDGDGVDEIVETWHKASHDRASSDTWLEVRRLDRGRFAAIRGPHTSVDHPDLGGCIGEVRLAGKTIVIDVEHQEGIPPSDCLAPGTHMFALDGNAIVEIDAPRVSRR